MTRSPTLVDRHSPFPLGGALAFLIALAGLASAQTFRIDTLFGGFDPLEESPLAEAWVSRPSALATDTAGNVYFVDRNAFRIRKVDATGQVSTIAGSGLDGYSGDGGPATSARLGRFVEGLAVDANGNVYIADTSNYRIRRVDRSGTIETLAGTGRIGSGGDARLARNASLGAVYGLAVDGAGNLYLADASYDKVRKIDTGGKISTVAGTGDEGVSGDGGPAIEALLLRPRGIALDSVGNLYIADSGNHRVRRVDPGGTITTFAGTGRQGYSGDGGPAAEAALAEPYDVAVDSDGNVYIADKENRIVRKVDADGTITTVAGIVPGAQQPSAGPGNGAFFSDPRALAVSPSGDVYIADYLGDSILRLDKEGGIDTFIGLGQPDAYETGGMEVDADGGLVVADRSKHRILRIDTSGVVTVIAGTGESGSSGDGGPATAARFDSPSDVALDGAGNTYVADTGNHRVRKIDAGGTVRTIAGTGEQGYGGDGGPALTARLNQPNAVAVDAHGTLYVADTGNHRIRRIDSDGTVTTVAGNGEDAASRAGVPATQSPLRFPSDVDVDSLGRIYFPARWADRVFMVDRSGMMTVVAGTGQRGSSGDLGPAVTAQLAAPTGVALSDSDTLYIADTFNHSIRRVSSDGSISTIAGSGTLGYNGDGFPATDYRLYVPTRVAASSDQTVFASDIGNHRIRVLTEEAPPPTISAVVNGASYMPGVAPGSVAVLRGSELSTGSSAAKGLPRSVALPTSLLGTSVIVAGRPGTRSARRKAGLYSIAPDEIRFQIPEQTAIGQMTVTVQREDASAQPLEVQVTNVAPGLFTANQDGRGVAAASAERVASDGTKSAIAVARYDAGRRRYVAVPLDTSEDLGPVYLTLFGTGMRNASGMPSVTIDGKAVGVESFGATSGFHGVDELVVGPIPESVEGTGLEVLAVVDGVVSNAVTIAVN